MRRSLLLAFRVKIMMILSMMLSHHLLKYGFAETEKAIWSRIHHILVDVAFEEHSSEKCARILFFSYHPLILSEKLLEMYLNGTVIIL